MFFKLKQTQGDFMKYLLLLVATNICFALNSFEQKCELIYGSGPFKTFKVNYEFLDYGKFQLKSVRAKWSKLSFEKILNRNLVI